MPSTVEEKEMKALEKRHKALEKELERMQMKIDLYDAIIKVASEELSIDIKKTYGIKEH